MKATWIVFTLVLPLLSLPLQVVADSAAVPAAAPLAPGPNYSVKFVKRERNETSTNLSNERTTSGLDDVLSAISDILFPPQQTVTANPPVVITPGTGNGETTGTLTTGGEQGTPKPGETTTEERRTGTTAEEVTTTLTPKDDTTTYERTTSPTTQEVITTTTTGKGTTTTPVEDTTNPTNNEETTPKPEEPTTPKPEETTNPRPEETTTPTTKETSTTTSNEAMAGTTTEDGATTAVTEETTPTPTPTPRDEIMTDTTDEVTCK